MSEEFLYEIGDEYQGTPSGISRFLKTVMKAGATVEINGDTVSITSVPIKAKKESVDVPKPADTGPLRAKEILVEETVTEAPAIKEPAPKPAKTPARSVKADSASKD